VSARSVHAINPLTASQFSAAFKESVLYNLEDCNLNVEELTNLFTSICIDILDSTKG